MTDNTTLTEYAGKGLLAGLGTTFASMGINEWASLIAAVLTIGYVLMEAITILPKMLDSIQRLKERCNGKSG